MRTNSFNAALAVAIIIAMSSCQSESPRTTDVALATMSNAENDRVYHISKTTENSSDNFVVHLKLNHQTETKKIKPLFTFATRRAVDSQPTHIGPFTIAHTQSAKKEAWGIQKLILEWIFDASE